MLRIISTSIEELFEGFRPIYGIEIGDTIEDEEVENIKDFTSSGEVVLIVSSPDDLTDDMRERLKIVT